MKKRKQPPHPLAAFLQQQPRSKQKRKKQTGRQPLFQAKPFSFPPLITGMQTKQRKQRSPLPFFDMSQNGHKRKPLLEQIQHRGSLVGPASLQVTRRKKIRHPRMPPLGDHDGDGAINLLDCQPLNPFKQDRSFPVVAKLTDSWGNPVDPKSARGKKIMAEVRKRDKWLIRMRMGAGYDPTDRLKKLPEGAKKEDIGFNPRKTAQEFVESGGKQHPIEFASNKMVKALPAYQLKDPHERKKMKEFPKSKDPEDIEFIKNWIDAWGPQRDAPPLSKKKEKKIINARQAAERRFPQYVPNWYVIYQTDPKKGVEGFVFDDKSQQNVKGFDNPIDAEKHANKLSREKGVTAGVFRVRGLGFARYMMNLASEDETEYSPELLSQKIREHGVMEYKKKANHRGTRYQTRGFSDEGVLNYKT